MLNARNKAKKTDQFILSWFWHRYLYNMALFLAFNILVEFCICFLVLIVQVKNIILFRYGDPDVTNNKFPVISPE